jgi:UDP-4-amino-4,6-dideoxy-N-acetyl-beta-L-altrosamine N-acetyltransferase
MMDGFLISLISVKKEHIPLMVDWRNDQEVSNMLFDRGRFTIAKQKAWFDKIKKDKSRKQFIIIENKTKKPIGAINLMNIDYKNLHCDWGYYIGETQYRMNGYAIEAVYLILKYAFEKLLLHRVFCQTLEFNKKAISVQKKFGFIIDGVLRQHYKSNDKYINVVVMSILKEEFDKSSKSIEALLNIYRR